MKSSLVACRSPPVLVAGLELAMTVGPAIAVPACAPTMVMREARCTELTLVGPAYDADLVTDRYMFRELGSHAPPNRHPALDEEFERLQPDDHRSGLHHLNQ